MRLFDFPNDVLTRILAYALNYPRTFDSRKRRIQQVVTSRTTHLSTATFPDFDIHTRPEHVFALPIIGRQFVALPRPLIGPALDMINDMLAMGDYVAALCCAASLLETRQVMDSVERSQARSLVAAARLVCHKRDPHHGLAARKPSDADQTMILDR